MGIKNIIEGAKQAGQLLTGEESKDTRFSSTQTYADLQAATEAFGKAKNRLFNVEAWSDISALSSTFTLHDASGNPKKDQVPQTNDYISIKLPGPLPENWVKVTDVQIGEKEAQFTVSPSPSPLEQKNSAQAPVAHFFTGEASSTFKLKQESNSITAWEIGKDEVVNNQGQQAGDRSVINTMIAAGGWAVFQKMQWQMVTDYVVGK